MASNIAPLTDEQCKEAAQIWLEVKNYTKLADRLGLKSRSAAQNRLKQAAKRGFLPTEPVMPGFEIAKETAVYDAEGKLVREFIQQKPEKSPYNAPAGHKVKGVSTLLDASGNVAAQWVKTQAGDQSPDSVAEAVKEALDGWKPKRPSLIQPAEADEDIRIVYPALDWHMDMRASASVTGDAEWNIDRAVDVFRECYRELISEQPPAETGLFLGLGDLAHRDGLEPLTTHNQHPLDVSGSYGEMALKTTDLVADIIEMMAAKHRRVKAVFKPGNHDETFTVALRIALHRQYRNDDRIEVDISDLPYYCEQFGINMIGGCHGEKLKLDDMPMKFANMWPEIFAVTKSRDIHSGHYHTDRVREADGFRTWTHRAPIPKQAYDAPKRWISGRSIKAFRYHVEKGHRGVTEVEIR